ncbi:MAG TPA: tetratricopeptide repeat protein [Pyrinomonadaceae bacterium]|nr:tetratricopeptide repeat protein [Pyrinomonadaceae bacterium]
MKRCPECRRDYYDDSLFYCLDDGSALLDGPAAAFGVPSSDRALADEPATAILSGAGAVSRESLSDADEPATARFSSSQNSQKAFIASPHNLTEDLSPLVGREREITEIERQLSLGAFRVLTLTGIGGTGKTRLALAVAWRMLLNFPDGVFFVNLAPITDPKLVTSIIAQTLGVQESGSEPILDALKGHVAGRKMLLVVDNFEQVSRAASDIERLINADPNLRVLVTSREPLRLRAEYEFAVPPLSLPSEGERLSADGLSKFESIRFFVERAQAVKPEFLLSETNSADVAAICRSLDGLPFAIELAAARIKLFEPQTILSRLSSSLKFLTGGAKELPERRQTMRGAIAWSYDLLSADEKQLLDRLSVFAGGFTIDSAEAVGAERGGEILDTVSSLLDKNLIERINQQSGDPRFRMLVVVREFALEKLEQSGTSEDVRRRHAVYFAQLVERAEPELRGSRAADWLNRLEQEHENIRLALNWTISLEPKIALRIAASVHRFWWRRGHLSEGVEWMRRILDATGKSGDPKLLASAYRGISSLCWNRGDFDAAVAFAEKGLEIARATGDKNLTINALHSVGTAKHNQGDFTGAQKFSEKALRMAREAGESFETADLANALGELARHREDYSAAQKFYEETLTIARENGYQQLNMLAAINLAAVACQLEDYQASHAYTLESMKISEEMGSTVSIGYALERFAALAVIGGEMERAARLSGAMESIYEAAGYKIEEVDRLFLERYLGEARSAMGLAAFELAKTDGKSMSVKDAIALARENEDEWRSTRALNIADSDSRSRTTLSSTTPDRSLENVPPYTTARSVSSAEYIVREVRRHRLTWLAAAALLVVGLGGFLAYNYFLQSDKIGSIAVMPFVNESGNADVEYLSDGMTETLIRSLSQLPNLAVKSRSTVFYYKGKDTSPKKIGEELGVQAILIGRVGGRGDDLKLSLELVNAQTQDVIWAEEYNRKRSDLVTLQSDIAKDVSAKLKLKLSGADEAIVAKAVATDAEAYQAYLKGRYYWNRRTIDNLRLAIEQFTIAANKDPSYALAYAGLADCYAVLPEYAGTPTGESLPQAKAFAERAIALDDRAVEPYTTLAFIHRSSWEWKEAEIGFKRAIEVNPNYATSYHWYSLLLRNLGRFDETASMIKRAQELDPLSSIIGVNVSDSQQMLGDHFASIETARKTIELDPTFSAAYENLGASLIEIGRADEGIANLEKAVELSNRSSVRLRGLGYGYAVTGRRSEALAIAKELEQRFERKESNGQYIAAVYAGLGDKDKAFLWLEKDFAARNGSLGDIVWRMHFRSLRDDPRYKSLLQRMGLPA